MFSSFATRTAISFSVIVWTAAKPREAIPMEMASGIDVDEGRSSSDLIEAMIAGRDLRAGRGAFVAVLVGAALGVEVVLPW